MKHKVVVVLVAAAVLVALAATALHNRDLLVSVGRRAPPRVVVIFKTLDFENFFWDSVREGVESAAKDYDVQHVIRGPVDEKYIDDQIRIIQEAIAEHPAAIVLAAADYNRLVPVAASIKAAGIRLVEIDSLIHSDDADAKIATDNKDAGLRAAVALMRHVSAGARVAIVSYVRESSTAIDREAGVRGYLEPRVNLQETLYSNSESGQAYLLARDLLSRQDDLDAMVALNLPSTLGAAKALKESGRQTQVALIGFDASIEVLQYIEEGVIRETVVQKPFTMGYLGVKTASDLVRGRRVQRIIDTECVVIDRTNMFTPENQKLLFPVPGTR